ncbi:MAG TPA: hypothetical protein VLW50_23965 [Streptosporangiaceae bacterium]|nr:hypothetical protein [Streptosporangiaceae bacterium]
MTRGEFYELIRRARASAWDSLRGDAAVALDHRVAADVLDRYAEELNSGSDYAAGHGAPLAQQGLFWAFATNTNVAQFSGRLAASARVSAASLRADRENTRSREPPAP